MRRIIRIKYIGAILDLNDKSGQNFLNNITSTNPGMSYFSDAKGSVGNSVLFSGKQEGHPTQSTELIGFKAGEKAYNAK